MREADKKIKEAISMGERNLELIKLAQNFCAHMRLEKARMGGTGIVEQMTGLPIGSMSCGCKYARANGFSGGDTETIAIDFYDRNCVDCDKRSPVGIPNLLNLIEEKKKNELERKRQQETQQAIYEKTKAVELEARRIERSKLRNDDLSRNSILDLIDKIDGGSHEDADKLIETAKIAPDKFDLDIQNALFSLIDGGNFSNVESAIETLTIIANNGQSINTDTRVNFSCNERELIDIDRLVVSSLKALDRGSGHNEAATAVEFWLDKKHEVYITDDVIEGLIRIAYPAREPLSFSATVYRPSPLQRIYDIFPEKVLATVRKLLAIDEKWIRVSAAGAARYIIEKDAQFGINIAETLLDSLDLSDDMYDGGSARVAAMHTLGKALSEAPNEIDKFIQGKIEKISSHLRGDIFYAYDAIFREDRRGKKRELPENLRNLVIKRLLETLILKPDDERLEKATDILQGFEYGHMEYLIGHEDLLLGAAAQIAAELDNPYSLLTDPRPDSIKMMESTTRRIHLQSALEVIMKHVGYLGKIRPLTIGNQVVECINNLKEHSGHLKSALISTLGYIGSSAQGLPLVLPSLSSGFSDSNSLVRSCAVESYGNLTSHKSVSLPSSLHELFCASLSDPYVLVHTRAVEVLRKSRLPEEYVPLIRNKLILLMLVYRQEKNGADFLARCIDELLNLTDRFQLVESKLANFVLGIMPFISPYERVKTFIFHRHQLKEAEKYSEQVATLLNEEYLYGLNIGEAMELVGELPVAEVLRIRSILKDAAKKLISNNLYGYSLEIIELLSIAYCWDAAHEVVEFFVNSIEDTTENKPLRLKALAYQSAVGLEVAILSKDDAKAEYYRKTWKENLIKIQKDNETNADRRSFFRGIRLPR